MKNYTHIKKEERDEISILLKKGYSLRSIAQALDRNVSTFSRELKRNRKKLRKRGGTGPYEPILAHRKAVLRKSLAKRRWKKINHNDRLREYVTTGLKRYWSPDEISGRMKWERQPFYVSKTAVYEWLYSSWGQYYCSYLYSQRYRPRKRRQKKLKRALIPNRRGIELRPGTIKGEYRHYEADTAVSGKKTGSKAALSVLHERRARYTDFERISSLKPGCHCQAQETMLARVTEPKTLTMDNGIENRDHEKLGLPIFFCDPYSAWQKGGVENSIKQIRRFIPKGTDISQYSDSYLNKVKEVLNNKPRKSLGYKTPMEVMLENNLLKIDVINLEIKNSASVALRG